MSTSDQLAPQFGGSNQNSLMSSLNVYNGDEHSNMQTKNFTGGQSYVQSSQQYQASSYQAAASSSEKVYQSSAQYVSGNSIGGSGAQYVSGNSVTGSGMTGSYNVTQSSLPAIASSSATNYPSTSYSTTKTQQHTTYPAITTGGYVSSSQNSTVQQSGNYVTQGNYSSSTNLHGGGRNISTATDVSRVVGHEYGQERVISVTQRVDESRTQIISERYVEHQIRVPKRIVREEIIEKIIVVPETIRNEEVIEELQTVREKIVEYARPVIVEKIVEVPQIEYIERIVEVPEIITQEKVREVEKIVQQERVQEVVKIVHQERVVEVPDFQYREVPYERIVEVADVRDEIIIKEVPVPQYVDKPVPEYVDIEIPLDINRQIPVPVEANIVYEFRMPKIKPRYTKLTYALFVPRFLEIPVAVELLDAGLLETAESFLSSVKMLTKTAASLCEIENLATTIMKHDMQTQISSIDVQSAMLRAWNAGMLNVSSSTTMTTTTTQYAQASSSAGRGY